MSELQQSVLPNKRVWIIVFVAALGYFVDIYDLIIFSIVRVQSFEISESQKLICEAKASLC